MTTGYSDRINHALAFAAKHHDRQVRKGNRAAAGRMKMLGPAAGACALLAVLFAAISFG